MRWHSQRVGDVRTSIGAQGGRVGVHVMATRGGARIDSPRWKVCNDHPAGRMPQDERLAVFMTPLVGAGLVWQTLPCGGESIRAPPRVAIDMNTTRPPCAPMPRRTSTHTLAGATASLC